MRFWSRQPRSSSARTARKRRGTISMRTVFSALAIWPGNLRRSAISCISCSTTDGTFRAGHIRSTTLPSSPSAHLNWHATAFRRFRARPRSVCAASTRHLRRAAGAAPVFGSARRRAAKDSSAASGAARRAPNTGVPACAGAARPGSAIGRSTGDAGSLTRSGGSCWRN